jgi:hypothetical protein
MSERHLIKLCSIAACMIIFCSQSFYAQQKTELRIGDRLVLELASSVFTQRSLETYVLVKHAVFSNGTYRNITASNWEDIRDEFLADMIIDREASRLGSFRVNPETMKGAMDKFDESVKTNSEFKAQISELRLSPPRLQQEIAAALRIEAFKRSKSPDRNVEMSDLEFQPNSVTQKQEWFLKFKHASMYRWYSGSSTYVRIKFNE